MKHHIRKYYNKIPEGYFKSMLKNTISYLLYKYPRGFRPYEVNGEKILLYDDNVFDNTLLATEVEGYNKVYQLKKGDIVIDGGAYSGLFSIYAAKKIGKSGKVFAFEPDPYNSTLLKRNLLLNKIKNVVIIKKGLYSKDDVLSFDIQGISSKLAIEGQHNQKSINKVPVVSIDNEMRRLGIGRVNFVKMDIEGAENEAVVGAKNMMKASSNIHFAIASYHIVNKKQTRHFLEKFFKTMGYKVKTANKNHLTTYASKK